LKYYNFEAELNGHSLQLPEFVTSEIGPNRRVSVMLTLTDATQDECVRDQQEADEQWADYSAKRLFEEDDSSSGESRGRRDSDHYDELLSR
jgi:hypothetical protein